MPIADALDHRLRSAMTDVRGFGPGQEVRDELVRALRRRHAHRSRALAATAAVVAVLAAGALAYGVVPGGGPGTTPRRAEAGPARRPVSLDALPCARVRVGTAPAACSGAYSKPDRSGSTGLPGAFSTAGGSSASATGAPLQPLKMATTGSAGEATPSFVEVAVGQSITVTLPTVPGVEWSGPRVVTADRTEVVQPVRYPSGAGTGRRFEARHPGSATLTAAGRRRCAGPPGRCGSAAVVWQVQVFVQGS